MNPASAELPMFLPEYAPRAHRSVLVLFRGARLPHKSQHSKLYTRAPGSELQALSILLERKGLPVTPAALQVVQPIHIARHFLDHLPTAPSL
jgi:hypothetical protein